MVHRERRAGAVGASVAEARGGPPVLHGGLQLLLVRAAAAVAAAAAAAAAAPGLLALQLLEVFLGVCSDLFARARPDDRRDGLPGARAVALVALEEELVLRRGPRSLPRRLRARAGPLLLRLLVLVLVLVLLLVLLLRLLQRRRRLHLLLLLLLVLLLLRLLRPSPFAAAARPRLFPGGIGLGAVRSCGLQRWPQLPRLEGVREAEGGLEGEGGGGPVGGQAGAGEAQGEAVDVPARPCLARVHLSLPANEGPSVQRQDLRYLFQWISHSTLAETFLMAAANADQICGWLAQLLAPTSRFR